MGGPGSGRRTLQPCGTRAKYQDHLRRKEEPCAACKEASADYQRKRHGWNKRIPKNRGERKLRRVEWLIQAKLERKHCVDCLLLVTRDNWPIFEWDHLDPAQKSFTIAQNRHARLELVAAEIAKCDLVCRNCHGLRTYKQIQAKKLQGKKKNEPLPGIDEASSLLTQGFMVGHNYTPKHIPTLFDMN